MKAQLVAFKIFLALAIWRAVQSRMLTPPIFSTGGASIVLAETCRCRVRMVTPNLRAASRVESFSPMM